MKVNETLYRLNPEMHLGPDPTKEIHYYAINIHRGDYRRKSTFSHEDSLTQVFTEHKLAELAQQFVLTSQRVKQAEESKMFEKPDAIRIRRTELLVSTAIIKTSVPSRIGDC